LTYKVATVVTVGEESNGGRSNGRPLGRAQVKFLGSKWKLLSSRDLSGRPHPVKNRAEVDKGVGLAFSLAPHGIGSIGTSPKAQPDQYQEPGDPDSGCGSRPK